MKKAKLLLSSIGSLVSQNVLDILEYPAFPRRDRVTVIGTNSIADSPNNFRADRCYKISNTNDPAFPAAMAAVIEKKNRTSF